MPNALISPEDLARDPADPDLVILDIRTTAEGGRTAYEEGHVPGAVHSDYATAGWRVKGEGGGAGLLPDPEPLGQLLGSVGIRPQSRVVVVPAGLSAGDFGAAARVYWTLRAAGHDQVAILDGGTAGWQAAGRPLETEPRAPRVVPAYPVTSNAAVRATLSDVERAVADRSATLVDSRDARSFAGEEKSTVAARGGRLPGAVHREGAAAFDRETNRLRSADRLAVDLPDGPAIAYCNTGQQAATSWFVLSEILGRPDVKLYDGSMSEWTHDPSRPVETGPVKTGPAQGAAVSSSG